MSGENINPTPPVVPNAPNADLHEAALLKSLEKIEAIAKASPEGRKRELFKKSLDGNVTAEETAELGRLMKGEPGDGSPPIGDALAAGVAGREGSALRKSVDVSEALAEMVTGLQTALREVGGQLAKSASASAETSIVLAEGLLKVGRLVKAQAEEIRGLKKTLDEFSQQPARGPKAIMDLPASLAKSAGGAGGGAGGGADPGVSPAEIYSLMGSMLEESLAKGHGGNAPCGEDLTGATARFETVGEISRPLMRDLANYRRAKLAKAANGEAGLWA